jgi:hypothetical protein
MFFLLFSFYPSDTPGSLFSMFLTVNVELSSLLLSEDPF